MSFLKPKTIEESILRAITNGPQQTTELLKEIDPHIRITKQGFYAALRKLKAEETVVIYKKMVALNTAWIRRMGDRVREMEASYMPEAGSASILALNEKESASYVFATTKHLDAFWGHAQTIVVNAAPAGEPVYAYDPHYWFYIARKETERRLIDAIVKEKRQFLMTVGGATALDKSVQADFHDDFRQYHIAKLFPRNTHYMVVIGEYVTEVSIDARVAARIEEIYASSGSADSEAVTRLEEVLAMKGRHQIKISRNARKAEELKRRLGKNFYIRK